MAASMTVLLANRGNPDHGQNPRRPLPDAPADAWVAVADYAEASLACRDYIAAHGLGNGNWTGGKLKVGREVVGYVSYNGRVWPGSPGSWKPGTMPLYPQA